MIGVTLFCVVCAVVAYFREFLFEYWPVALVFVPTALICFTLITFAQRRKPVLIISLVGAFFGYFFIPAEIHMGALPVTVWKIIWRDYTFMFFSPPLGSLLFGGAALA